MLPRTKILLSLGILGAAGGIGTAGYFLTQKILDDSVNNQLNKQNWKRFFYGKLVFYKDEENESEDEMFYKSELVDTFEYAKKYEDGISEDSLIVLEISDFIDKNEVQKYLVELDSYIKNISELDKLQEKLTEYLKESANKTKFEVIFGKKSVDKFTEVVSSFNK